MNTTDHLIKSYDDELARLTGEITRMGELALAQLAAAVDAVEQHDEQAARRIIDNDDALDAMEHDISHDVVRLLALRSPMARDLREVFAALRIAGDIERIGDYAVDIAKRGLVLPQATPGALVRGLRPLAELAAIAVRKVLDACRDRDPGLARQAWREDDKLDEAYVRLFRELLTYMMEDPHSITACTHLLFMAKHVERIGDHATNIAENVWFAVKGENLKAP